MAIGRPVHEVHQRVERVGQIGLKHDAGIESLELGTRQDPDEGLHGEFQVVVLLHVEIDEGRRISRGGSAEQCTEPPGDPFEAPLPVPIVEL